MSQAEGQVKGAAGGMGGFFGQAFSFATGGLIASGLSSLGGAVTGFFSDAIGDARNADMLMASTAQTIETMGNAAGRSTQDIADMASALSDAAGKSLFGDDQIQQSENLLLTFGEIKGATFDAATALTVDLAAALGGAPKDQAMMLGKALNDPIHGLTALGKAGLTFSEEQKSAIAAMQESGDMAGAQAIIIAELNRQVGGQAEAQAKAAGGMVQLKARLGEAGEAIGHLLIPVLNLLAGFLLDTIMPAIESVVAGVGPFIASFQSAGEQSGILGDVLGVLGNIWTQVSEIIGLAIQLIQAIVVPVFTAIAGFITAHGAEIQAVLSGVWTVISTVITTVLGVIKGVILLVLALIQGDWQGAWDAIKGIAVTVWAGISTIISVAANAVKALLDIVWGLITGAATAAWEGIKGAISTAFSPVTDAVSTISGNVKSALDTAWGTISGAATTAWGGIKSAVQSAWEPVKGAVTTVAGNAKTGLDTVWGTISGAATTAWGGIKGAIDTAWGPMKGAVTGVVDGLKTALDTAWGVISGAASTAWGGIATAVGTAFGGVAGAIRGVVNQAIDYVNSLIDAYNSVAGTLGLGSLDHISHIAGGTQFFGGGLALVGELGPELVAMPRGAQVFTASDTRAMLGGPGGGGGQTTTINIDARGTTDPRGVEDAVRRALSAAGIRGDVFIRTR